MKYSSRVSFSAAVRSRLHGTLPPRGTPYSAKRGGQDIALADDQKYLDFWKELWTKTDYTDIAKTVLSRKDIWEQDLSADDDNVAVIAGYIESIVKNGERAALKAFLGE